MGHTGSKPAAMAFTNRATRASKAEEEEEEEDGDIVAPGAYGYTSSANESPVVDELSTNRTALFTACKAGDLEQAKVFMAKPGMGVNMTEPAGGSSALQWACSKGHVAVAAWLLELGADVTVKNRAGADALQLAAKSGSSELAALLLDRGADVNSRDMFSKTPLHYAAYLNNSSVCDLLVRRGAEVDAAGLDAGTPLFHTVKAGHRETAAVLLSHGANMDLQNSEGDSPKSAAARKGIDLVELSKAAASGG